MPKGQAQSSSTPALSDGIPAEWAAAEGELGLLAGSAPVRRLPAEDAPLIGLLAESAPVRRLSAEDAPLIGLLAESTPVRRLSAEDAPLIGLLAESAPVRRLSAEDAPLIGLLAESAPVRRLSAEDAPLIGLLAGSAPVGSSAEDEPIVTLDALRVALAALMMGAMCESAPGVEGHDNYLNVNADALATAGMSHMEGGRTLWTSDIF